ncbi:MAG: putative membrane protein [Glaciecola sp.]|jgi:uncharacterized membrane protein
MVSSRDVTHSLGFWGRLKVLTSQGPAVTPLERLHIKRPTWRHHPAVRPPSDLTLGERAADRIRNGMGSWGFVMTAMVFLAGWMLGNRNIGFDKYPFILLNLILSCLAAMQGAILLIAAKREDQISSELARHDYETDLESQRLISEIRDLTLEIHAASLGGVPASEKP